MTTPLNILVTGSEGYIGSMLAPLLLSRGHHVVGLDTGYYRNGWLYNPATEKFPVQINKDIRKITAADLHGFDAVVHLAELSNDPLGQLHPEITYTINHQGTVELAKKCKGADISRFVYTSSCSVYGVGSEEWKTETSLPNPQTAYANCKVLVERDLSDMANDDFSPTFLRNATAYGPSPRMRFDLVLNNLAGLAWTTREIRMTSDGTPWRPLVHVRDICHAIACTLEAPREVVHNEIFNVGSTEENYRVRDIAQVVAQVFPACEVTFGTQNGDNRSYRVCFDKIAAELPGFVCHHTVRTGAQKLYAIFERISMSRDLFEYKAFTRLKQIEYLLKTQQLDTQFFWS